MDPLSATASVVGIWDTVSKLSKAIARFRHDYALADEDLNIARHHALLLKEEISRLGSSIPTNYSPTCKDGNGWNDTGIGHSTMDETSFAKAMSTARDLLSGIEVSFPLRSEPHTWKSRMRWAMKDKKALDQLKERLQSTESTLHGIVSLEQL